MPASPSPPLKTPASVQSTGPAPAPRQSSTITTAMPPDILLTTPTRTSAWRPDLEGFPTVILPPLPDRTAHTAASAKDGSRTKGPGKRATPASLRHQKLLILRSVIEVFPAELQLEILLLLHPSEILIMFIASRQARENLTPLLVQHGRTVYKRFERIFTLDGEVAEWHPFPSHLSIEAFLPRIWGRDGDRFLLKATERMCQLVAWETVGGQAGADAAAFISQVAGACRSRVEREDWLRDSRDLFETFVILRACLEPDLDRLNLIRPTILPGKATALSRLPVEKKAMMRRHLYAVSRATTMTGFTRLWPRDMPGRAVDQLQRIGVLDLLGIPEALDCIARFLAQCRDLAPQARRPEIAKMLSGELLVDATWDRGRLYLPWTGWKLTFVGGAGGYGTVQVWLNGSGRQWCSAERVVLMLFDALNEVRMGGERFREEVYGNQGWWAAKAGGYVAVFERVKRRRGGNVWRWGGSLGLRPLFEERRKMSRCSLFDREWASQSVY